MKNLFLSMALVCATTGVFANSAHNTKISKISNRKAVECTVSATVAIPGGTAVTISSTSATCAAAVADVAAGVRAIRAQF